MRKKILIFSIAYYPFCGGAEVAVKENTDRIKDFQFDMVTLRFDKKLSKFEKIGNINVYRIGFCGNSVDISDLNKFPLKINKYLFPFLAYLKARKLYKKNKYDIVWAIMANYSGFGALFFKIFHKKVKYLLTLQEGDPLDYYRKRIGMLFSFFKKIFTKADSIQVISKYLGDYACDMGFKGKPILVPNAVNIKHFSSEYKEEELRAFKKKLGKEKDDIFVITTSRLAKKNAIGDVIKAFEFLPKNIKFLILGIGPDEKKIRELAKEKKVDERILFLGYVDHKIIPKYLKISDIFIRPSLSEGFGNSFVEAMAAGIPVIATPVGGIVDFLFDPDKNPDKKPTGIFCEVNNPESIADKINRLTKNPSLVEEIIGNAKELAVKKYDWDIIAKDMERMFKNFK
ncbi:MAG: glycosyltransferase family 4 protein [Patescibacteria group bacterium]|nr:glycosyltransferase family 4 protein [Patescibacteria group bacterium]